MHSSHRARRLLAGAAIAGSLLVAASCGDDDDDASDVSSEVSSAVSDAVDDTDGGEASGETVEITAIDYRFEDVPESIEAGSTLALHNDSDGEVHEIVAFRIPDTETRSVDDLMKLSEAEQEAIFGAVPPSTVIVALPGEDGEAVEGFEATLTEPGRYAIICTIPLGADPDVVAEAMESGAEEQPDLGNGAPHFTQGMYAELVVE